ncbi:trypsin-like peptidase domain-containing protein [Streptomyces profundus]|uniref:VMAP-C domain-containing protein n=1 Tax=Streptomyces profundus TaxID=2867410 RepID=UPI0022410382|nr:trypsin-like peptidase domain-containing protein [Streptomyces sp. MA3_2.13]UED84213.1 serine protease [Streptomyces sp. MA3_2.13]
MGEDPFETLAPLIAAATVRIHPPPTGYAEGEPPPPPRGSGFFVAPEWVLTCAHVALGGGGGREGRREVGLTFKGVDRPVAGRVEWAEPEEPPPGGGFWPAPDLALVRLLEPPPPGPLGPGCVWLTERTARVFTRDEVAFFGFTEVAGAFEDISGRCTIKGQMGGDGLLRLGNEDEMLAGVSGGPLVDLARGEVIGVIKARRDGSDGGLATSVVQLRSLPDPVGPVTALADDGYQRVLHAHDTFHVERHRDGASDETTWTDAQSELTAGAPGALTPGQRVELLGLFADLPPPVSTKQLAEVITRVRGRPYGGTLPAPRAWRDGLGLLYDLRQGVTELEAVLRYAIFVATEERPFPASAQAEKALREWVHRLAAVLPGLPRRVRNQLGLEEEEQLRRRADQQRRSARFDPLLETEWELLDLPEERAGEVDSHVLLEITPHGWEQGRYDWRVCAVRGDGQLTSIAEEFRAVGPGDPPGPLRAALAEAFRRGDEPRSPVPLHVAVPYSLLGFPVERWRLAQDGPTLGERRPVVVRCTNPVAGAEDSEEMRTLRLNRWTSQHQGRMVPDILDCHAESTGSLPRTVPLIARDPATVPVLCHTPASGGEPAALHRVMASGYNVILWRREIAERDPECGDFHQGVAGAVGGAGQAGRLPAALWRLREAAAGSAAEAGWSRQLALLYADPRGPLLGEDDFLEAP